MFSMNSGNKGSRAERGLFSRIPVWFSRNLVGSYRVCSQPDQLAKKVGELPDVARNTGLALLFDEKFDWKAFSESEELDRTETMQKRRAVGEKKVKQKAKTAVSRCQPPKLNTAT